ncbi:uncharacterized protein LOC112084363 [Eutrema salsugineum]|uniref:uncharacterized protein LOC112084363 n=1 Tax=Eutrema salsugineum TaxID=72664 RepID=UPI000CECF61A|nr:uncharacterized protein LOC112084363 [Eutrema salsugineum]
MSGISIDVACHELNVDPTFKPIKQKRRKLGPERAKAVNDEVERLIKVGLIPEAKYPDWLANLVVVKKKNGKWRVRGHLGEFLGYLVTHRGIEANPKQIKALIEMPSPRTKREVQRLTGRVAALNRFISRSTDKCLSFYDTLRGNKKFEWDERCEAASHELKSYLASPPILAKPVEGEPFFLYIAVSATAIEKVALAVVVSARKLRPYFQSYSIVVLATLLLRSILHSPSQSGRLAKWAIELSEYDIEYRNRSSAKSQVLADFLIELSAEVTNEPTLDEAWTLHVDGSSSKHGSGIGINLTSPTGEILEQSFRLNFYASNNEAEYEALITDIQLAQGIGVRRIRTFCDSQLVACRFNREYEAKDRRMGAYLKVVRELVQKFDEFELTRIPRGENTSADALAALASTSDPDLRRTIPVEFIERPSIEEVEGVRLINPPEQEPENDEAVAMDEDASPTKLEYGCDKEWLGAIRVYIADGEVPIDKWEARKLKAQAARYVLVDGEVFKWRFSGPLMTCVKGPEARKIMHEVHSGACENHSSGRSLAIKIKRHGYFWPTMVKDNEKFTAKCEKCQRHAPTIHQPTELLSSISSSYPFMRWSMDIVGPLHRSKQKRFLLVLTDYFSKWVEADSYASIKDAQVKHFVWKNIICRNRVPYEIVTDNGS